MSALNDGSIHFRCLCCGGTAADPSYRDCQDYYLGKPFRVTYFQCRNCRLLQQHPVPRDVSAFYEDYPIHKTKSRAHNLIRKLVMSQVYFRPAERSGSQILLDYGCGDGGYLQEVQGRFSERLGYEPVPTHAAHVGARLKVPIYTAGINQLLAERRDSVDVLTMHFVLEHLLDLHGAFEQVRELLKPGGTFYFVVPQTSSWEGRLFGSKWHGLDPPRHISFPEPPVVSSLSRQHGFTLASHRAVSFPNGIAGTIPVLLVGRFTFPLFALSLPAAFVISRLVPTGCRAFWLTKG